MDKQQSLFFVHQYGSTYRPLQPPLITPTLNLTSLNFIIYPMKALIALNNTRFF